jgi:iron-sulfur cluster assembly accessory protein
MNIKISKKASQKLISSIENSKNKLILLKLKKYGCTGYAFSFEEIEKPLNNLETHITGFYLEFENIEIIKDVNIDYATDHFQKKFTFEHPKMQSMCGCGESFLIG